MHWSYNADVAGAAVFEVLGKKQRRLGANQKLILSALLALERDQLGEVVFTASDIFKQYRVAAPRCAGGGNGPLSVRTLVVKRLVHRGLVDQPRPGCATLTAAGRDYALRPPGRMVG